jgi:small subunit ribosomal protein S8
MLTRIRNRLNARKVNGGNTSVQLARLGTDVLADEGCHLRVTKFEDTRRPPAFEISLKYYEGTPVREGKRVSSSSRLHGRQ